jgi:hypothetical protein
LFAHLEEMVTHFPDLRADGVVMSESVTPRNSTKDGVFPKSTTVVDLPSPATKRWVPRRKALIVDAVRQGAISLEEVCRRYQLSVEEFLAWQRAIETHGVPGLRITRLQIYGISRVHPPARPSDGAPRS